jgi:ketosteroid isomerase-like protein
MRTEDNVYAVEAFSATVGDGDKPGLLALAAENIDWIIPGGGWPLHGMHRGHAGLEDFLWKAAEAVETSFSGPF